MIDAVCTFLFHPVFHFFLCVVYKDTRIFLKNSATTEV
jgi:hypothetical protein